TIVTYGHDVGEDLMRAAARRMLRIARTTDVVGRIDDATLGVLIRGLRSGSEARRLGRLAYEALVDVPIVVSAGATPNAVSCGFAIAEPDGDVAELVRRATHPKWQTAASHADGPP